jgi:hypothetical protein
MDWSFAINSGPGGVFCTDVIARMPIAAPGYAALHDCENSGQMSRFTQSAVWLL